MGAEVKLFYCVPTATDDDATFAPYDLRVVSKDFITAHKHLEHYTMAASGVVHVRPGVVSEFSPLGAWIRDASVFALLRQMPFFRHYLARKMFTFWKQNVRYRLYATVRAKIERSLFLVKPAFNPTVMALGALCNELRENALVTLNPTSLYVVDEFKEAQEKQRKEKAYPTIESVGERMQECLEKVIRVVVDEVRRMKVVAETNKSLAATVSKTKSMVQLKRERHERSRAYKRCVEESAMLPTLVRLADFMLTEALVGMGQNNMNALMSLFAASTEDPKSKGVFVTTVAFAHDLTTFTPNADVMMKALDVSVTQGVVAAVGSVPRLVHNRAFAPLFEQTPDGEPRPADAPPVLFEGDQAQAVLLASPEYQNVKARIEQTVRNSFEQSKEYALALEDNRAIYKFGMEWNKAEYEAAPKTVAQFRADMRVQRDWVTQLDRTKLAATVGVLSVDVKPLRNELSSTVVSMLESMKALLLVAAREESTAAR